MTAKALVSRKGERIVKKQGPEAARSELQRTLAAVVIASQTGEFSVPTVERTDIDNGVLEFRFQTNLISLRTRLAHKSVQRITFEKLGRTLATIHRNLADPIAPGISGHGDFSVENVQTIGASDDFFILDWSQPAWISDKSIVVQPYFDVLVMIQSIFYRNLVRYPFGAYRKRLAAAFLTSYDGAVSGALDSKALKLHANKVYSHYLQYLREMNNWRIPFYLGSVKQAQTFLRNL